MKVLKKCPYCAEWIKSDAVKCKHCKSDLPTEDSPALPPVEHKEEFDAAIKDNIALVEPEKEEIPATEPVTEKDNEKEFVPEEKITSTSNESYGEALVVRLMEIIKGYWKRPKFRKGTYITSGVVAVIIIALIVVSFIFQKSYEEIYIERAVGTVNQFVSFLLNEDYSEALNEVGANDSLLKAFMIAFATQKDGESLPFEIENEILSFDDAEFRELMTTSESNFTGLLPSLKEAFKESGLSSEGYRKAFSFDDYCVVVIKKDKEDTAGGTLMVPRGADYISLSSAPMILYGADGRTLSEAVNDKVNEWLESPTKESCEASIELIKLCDGLEAKYDFLLSDEYRNNVASTGCKMASESEIEKGKEVASRLPELLARADREMDNFRTVDDYIALTSPKEGQQYPIDQPVKVQGTTKIDCELTLNGTQVGIDTKTKAFAPVEPIVEGQNIISLVVESESGKIFQKDITVIGVQPQPTAVSPVTPTTTPLPSSTTVETVSQKNALAKAKSYLEYSAFSHDGLVEQLEYEQFSHADAVYGADNCGANWNEQAAKKAQSYMDYSSFSRGGLIDQLKYEGFTQAQAEYGANAVGL